MNWLFRATVIPCLMFSAFLGTVASTQESGASPCLE